ncbi:WecB/TagA/CpsF family glycosyltransferase [Ancylothrix sp. C2]|uniref:WecB/TagA/CpsF family glycosyltransferase n=1 Tax=Ancylothrix sp. D3o TaxID=2953691 RepID=UPI0021BAC91D|nr:WecB/TagA/CpsF family glycosyltransferase [Ancylothrix sp. D3o]MCT7949098.1 WecB/TagA/CpsF family glycosyltransferase [Ancylothrix sp. D3o]
MQLEAAKKFKVLGQPVHLLQDYPTWLIQRLQQGKGSHVVTLNAEMTMQAKENPDLAAAINQAELVIPDGAGVVIYLQMYKQKVQRCPGIELAEALLKQAEQLGEKCPVYFYGGAPGIAQTAAQYWHQKTPNLKIAGITDGYINPDQQKQLCQTLKTIEPKIILVGLGVPRQELWITQNRHHCPNAIWIGIGGSFDIWAGIKNRAPYWMQKLHLEWLYRLYQEPWRWRRMLALPHFALIALLSLKTQTQK